MLTDHVSHPIAEVIEKADAEAKAAGRLKGRYIEHPTVDGGALLQVVAVGKLSATMEVIGRLPRGWPRVLNFTLEHVREKLAERDTA